MTWNTYIIISFHIYPSNHSWVTARSCLAHRNPPSARHDYLNYYLSLLILTYLSWWYDHLPILDLVTKIKSFSCFPSTTSVSAWLEYPVLSWLMTSSVTLLLLKYIDLCIWLTSLLDGVTFLHYDSCWVDIIIFDSSLLSHPF